MAPNSVECLACGARRSLIAGTHSHLATGECPRCGYVGWAQPGDLDDQFPIDVFQTGSGTSSNMNANEVIATLAGDGVHANDHVNRGQSSNDVFPSAVHLAALEQLTHDLVPALDRLAQSLEAK